MAKTLLIDIDVCNSCTECTAGCRYFNHKQNNGVAYLRELAAFAAICRKCEVGNCVAVCPTSAMKKEKDGIVRRSNILCVGCRSCSVACPFGSIHPEVIEYLSGTCDLCQADGIVPSCASTCTKSAIRLMDALPEQCEYYRVSQMLAVKATPWRKENAR
jgi:Fe-S-cluster-containing dehydrogenase component